jgi:outer membrane lipoprotein-sorting protein
MKLRFFAAFALIAGAVFGIRAQEILTAGKYLDQVSERYASFRDYEARIAILSGGQQMYGTVSYLRPNFLRIDFSQPSEQVITYNGETLMVYLPGDRAILSQAAASGQGANVATSQGLSLLKRNYIPAYVSGPDAVPLEEGAAERVVKIRLQRRAATEGFREIIMDVSPDTKMIRRLTGTTINNIKVQFDFSSIRTNVGVPEQRFAFDAPAATNMFNNFLYKDSE